MTAAPRRRGRGLACAFAVLAVVAVLAIAFGGVVLYARGQLEAPQADHAHTVTVQVSSGETLDQLSSDLEAKGVVRSAFWFKWFARFKGLGDKLEVGRFKLDTGMGASAVIVRLEGAPDVTVKRVVLAEGLTAQQMAQKVAAAGLNISADQYLNEVKKGQFNEPFLVGRPQGASLEGFLFPDTYEVPAGTTAHQLVQMQLDDFAKRTDGLLQAAQARGLHSGYELVVMASIIEREARFDNDRPQVASVLYNRLAAGMDLQVDASVLYGLGLSGSGNSPTYDQLHVDTPYNTYLHSGLTPTPISNPGLASIQAAAQPASTKFLFYVSDACGHNHYSTTQAEHDQQTQQYVNSQSTCPPS